MEDLNKKTMKYLSIIGLVGLLVIGLQSCYSDNKEDLYQNIVTGDCDTTNVTYSSTVAPILATQCATSGCHNSTTRQSGYDFSNYNDAMGGATRIIARTNDAQRPMPPSGLIASCDRQQLEVWVNDGAPNN